MAGKAIKRTVKSVKRMNFLENPCQKIIFHHKYGMINTQKLIH